MSKQGAPAVDQAPRFRPPAEAGSLILQIDRGCPHNQCAFCGMYKDVRYTARSVNEILTLIRQETRHAPETRRVFLADGDATHLPFSTLLAVLNELNACLPELARVNAYANGRSILAKSADTWRALRALKLHTLYMGLESGDAVTLRAMDKEETAEDMIAAGRLAQDCGLKMSVMILLGLGGTARSAVHARATAEALNRMQPRLLSALRVIPVPGTRLHRDLSNGRFQPLTEHEIVWELRQLIAGLELEGCVFRANHASNIVPLEARLPRDKERLLAELDALLASDALDRKTPGAMPLYL